MDASPAVSPISSFRSTSCATVPARALTRRDIAALMSPADYVTAVEAGFRAYANGDAEVAPPAHLAAADGTFHAKTARMTLDRSYVALKLNGNFPGNAQRNGLPTIQGVVVLCDGADGTVLAVLDSIEITLRRTAAATALAAAHLAPDGSDVVALCGCGAQGRAQVEALAGVLPVRLVKAWDIDPDKAVAFAREMAAAMQLEVVAVAEPARATLGAHVVVTATTSRRPFLSREMVSPGAFVAAVGADNPEKSELMPQLLANATVVVDLLAQAATMGDLHHAIEAGIMRAADVHAEIAEIVVGRKAGRARSDEIIVFDSTGTALQDAASAIAIWQRAVAEDAGTSIHFGDI